MADLANDYGTASSYGLVREQRCANCQPRLCMPVAATSLHADAESHSMYSRTACMH